MKIEYYNSDTGCELAETETLINRLEAYLGKIVRLRAAEKSPESTPSRMLPICYRPRRRPTLLCAVLKSFVRWLRASLSNGYPVSLGHALIISKRHVANYFDLTNHECEAMNVVLQYVKQKVDERFHPDGNNVGININEAAGQSVFHCHMHLIPRYKGDVPKNNRNPDFVFRYRQNEFAVELYPLLSFNISMFLQQEEKPKEKTYTLNEKRKQFPNAYKPWSTEDDKLLVTLHYENRSIELKFRK